MPACAILRAVALSNRSFEAAGVLPGEAASWSVALSSSGEILANFSDGIVPPIPVETFETGWGNNDYATKITDANSFLSAFGSGDTTTDHENFETGWGNDNYLTQLGGTFAATMSDGGEVEHFETGWDNDNYKTAFDDIDLIDAVMTGGGNTETFETGYGNDTYLTTISSFFEASFDGDGSTVEDFEQVSPIRSFVADQASDVFISADHAMPVDHPVNVKGPGLPSGFATGVIYYVRSPTTNTFKLSLTAGGVPITLTEDGQGTVFGDPKQFWNEVE